MATRKKSSLNEIAYNETRKRIITMQLKPGGRIDENELARELRMGRTPVREALFRLSSENLVEILPQRGFFARDITLSDVKALFEAMLFLEQSAALLASRRISREQLQELRTTDTPLITSREETTTAAMQENRTAGN